MTDLALVKQIAELFQTTGEAHHKAFIQTDGADPDWPLWYAEYLQDKLAPILKAKFTKSELTYLIVSADKEQATRAPGADWPSYYARFLIHRFL